MVVMSVLPSDPFFVVKVSINDSRCSRVRRVSDGDQIGNRRPACPDETVGIFRVCVGDCVWTDLVSGIHISEFTNSSMMAEVPVTDLF